MRIRETLTYTAGACQIEHRLFRVRDLAKGEPKPDEAETVSDDTERTPGDGWQPMPGEAAP